MLKVTEFFLNDDIPPFLLGAFYGRYEFTSDNKYIYTYSTYKSGEIYKNPTLCERSKNSVVIKMNKICERYPFWFRNYDKEFPRANIAYVLENDSGVSKESFFNKLNTKLYSSNFAYESGLTESKKMFIRGFSELRSSVDRSHSFLAMDYTYNNMQEMKRARFLIDYMDVPVCFVNYNFREFQPDFMNGIQRKTQLRYNVFWYAKNIGFVNEYRAAVFRNNFNFKKEFVDNDVICFECVLPLESGSITFENRLAYYAKNVLGKKLTKSDVQKFRDYAGINDVENSFRRDSMLADVVRWNTPDECVCCCDDYNIEDRSHTDRKTGRYYFEIHHMISIGKVKELDDVDNLAKICPSCHRALKKGSGEEELQKEMIRKIFSHKANIYEFCKSYFDEEEYENVVDNVWKSLK